MSNIFQNRKISKIVIEQIIDFEIEKIRYYTRSNWGSEYQYQSFCIPG